jgi:hypothetical protein
MKLFRVVNFIFLLLVVVSQYFNTPALYAQTLIESRQYPSYLVAKDRYLYWSDASETPVNKIPNCGGGNVPLVPKMDVPAFIEIQGNNIFWIDQRSGISPSGSCTGTGVIWILKKTSIDGNSTTILDIGDNCNGPSDRAGIALVDEEYMYWVESVVSPDVYTIKKVPIIGGAPSTSLVSAPSPFEIFGLTDDATHIYWVENIGPDPDLSGNIKRISKSTGETEVLATGLNSFRGGLSIYGGDIFFVDSNDYDTQRLMKVSVSGGEVTLLKTITRGISEPRNDINYIAVDSENLYWVDQKNLNTMSVNGGSIVPLASLSNEPLDIIVNSNKVFWTETTGPAHGETGTVKSIFKSGGIETVFVQGGDAPRKLALFDDSLYWTEGGVIGHFEGFGRIVKTPVNGGEETTVIAGISSSSPPIAVNSSHLFIADKWRIKRLHINGGIVETIVAADDGIEDIAIDESNIYWIEEPISAVRKAPLNGGLVTTLSDHGSGWGPPGPIRVLNGYVYWMDGFDTIEKVSVAGGPISTLASDLPFLNDFIVDETNVYFSEHDTGAIKKISINGGPTSTLVIRSFFYSPRYLAIDDQDLYWIDQKDVGFFNKGGGEITVVDKSVMADPFFHGSIEVDTTGIYWTETATGDVEKYFFAVPDVDGDCVPDSEDLFPNNPEEWEDNDSDGIGNNTDPDDDNDGIPDFLEDRNQNGVLDEGETSPYNSDTDGDGITDSNEDSDGDGFTNIEEILCGSDLADSHSRCTKGLPWLMLLLE